jgi:hypothetical protein
MKLLKLTLLLIATALLAIAANVDGVWKADYTSPDGSARTMTFHFKADGDKLTGKAVSQTGESEVKNGTIKGDDISFTLLRNFGGNEVNLKYAGKVAANEIKLTVSFNDNSFDIVAKRQGS